MNKLRDGLLFLGILLLIFPFAGCKTTRKATKSKEHISLEHTRLSSKKISRAIEGSYLHYQTLSAKIHIDFKSEKEKYNNVTAYLRMKKDSIIWLSIRPVLGIEMVRLMITPDSIKLRNNLKGKTESRSTKDIEEVIHIPFKFEVLESLFIGNPPIIPHEINDFRTDTSDIYATFHEGKVIFEYQWSKAPFLLQKSHFQMAVGDAYADQQYDAYKKISIGLFSFIRDISIQSSSFPMDIHLTFDKIRFNEPVQFPF